MSSPTTSSPDTSFPSTRILRRPDGSIAYDIQGSGPTLVLVPGMGDLRSTYRFVVPRLVDAGFTVVTCDLRGHGESDSTFSSYGDDDTAEDIAALLRELGGTATVVGNSMAAGSAVIAAAKYPELVERLVLIGPFVREPESTSAVKRIMLRILLARPWIVAVWRGYLPSLYAGAKPADFEEHRNAIVASLRRPGYAMAFNRTTKTSHAAAEQALARITAPTLILMGAQDPDFPDPKAEAEWIRSATKGTSVLIPDAGHYPQAQQPERTVEALVEFLTLHA
jgi:pimeloyl-ACP methyl ester carboxylesterase